jgi:purine-binding chemotaxis protein CheW
MEHQLVVFELNHEYYAVDIAAVESIIKVPPITMVPHTLDYVEGVINLRGNVLPVIALHKRLGLPQQPLTKNSRIVVVMTDALKVGMIVDVVSEVLSVPFEVVERPPNLMTVMEVAFITGIAKTGGRLIILLDVGKLTSPDDLCPAPLSADEESNMEPV